MNKFAHVVIGGAGFIGSNLCTSLLQTNNSIYVIDDLSLGSRKNIDFIPSENFYHCDASDFSKLLSVFADIFSKSDDSTFIKVWHLAANSDILAGVHDLMVDVSRTFNTTVSLLKVMEHFKLSHLCFASSSAIYGDQGDLAISEDCGNLNPRSTYGAMKLASEALISSAREKFLKEVSIFRFPNVVGAPATHGILFDFKRKLLTDSTVLRVLGDGTQCKPYLHVKELISAMLHIDSFVDTNKRSKIFNIGPYDGGVKVATIAHKVVTHYGKNTNIIYGVGNKGWIGDIPKFYYDISALKSTGWEPQFTSEQAIDEAIAEIFSK